MADLRAGSSTHTGQIRPENEDNLLVTDRVFVVADGMGGHEAGEVASQIAVDRIGELLEGDQPPAAPDVVEAIRVANGDIFRAAIANPGQHGMGTTVTAIAVISDPYAGRAAPNIDLNDGIDGVDGDETNPATSRPWFPPFRARRSCSPTSATRAPTSSVTDASDASRSTTATCRNSSPPATSPRTRRATTPAATSSPAPWASNPRFGSTGGRCR